MGRDSILIARDTVVFKSGQPAKNTQTLGDAKNRTRIATGGIKQWEDMGTYPDLYYLKNSSILARDCMLSQFKSSLAYRP